MTLAGALVVGLAGLVLAGAQAHVLLHILQQEHYETARLGGWLRRDLLRRLPLVTAAAFAAACVVIVLVASASSTVGLVLAVAGLAAALVRSRAVWRREQVKPLVFTARARRLYAVALLLSAVAPALALWLADGDLRILLTAVAGTLMIVAAPLVVGAANALLRPYQAWETRGYVRAARRKLEGQQPLVVGISGSFGKTTTKACVAAALSAFGEVCPTPASYNSLLGVVRAINENLGVRDKVFVAELGAYRVGDIAELCELVRPRLGILASLGPAHLERFGSMDAIERAEGELADALPPDGLFVTRADDERCRRVAAERARCPAVLISPQPHPDADLWASDVTVSQDGATFSLCRRGGAEPVRVRSRLLGDHNIANLLAAAALARHVGLSDAQIARSLRLVEAPEHRLKPIVNAAAGIVVIDDSYNSNPIGAAAALDALAAYEAQRRILVTPGMVELGELEAQENFRLGERAAAVCDICILSGPLAATIGDGLLSAGFPADAIITAPDGPSAHASLTALTRRGDVILFENDLPDVYV